MKLRGCPYDHHIMRVLLLTDIPPCSNLTAGLVLEQLCRFMPRGSLVCFTVLNPHLSVRVSSDLEWIPVAYARKPWEVAIRWPQSSSLGSVSAWIVEEYHSRISTRNLLKKAEIFARTCGIDAIWAVLEGQTMVRMALPLAERLGVPLFTQVFDPLSWWLRAHGTDAHHSRAALVQFNRTLQASEACATASKAMAEAYSTLYGTRCVPVISSHDATIAARPSHALSSGSEVTIAMAGQFYAADEWNSLIRGLEVANWMIAGRKVRLRVLGAHKPDYGSDLPQIEFLGWKSQPEAVQILSQADILYCPYPFDAEMEEVSRLSFPSKLVLYLASGRPILFHGPTWSSPGRYMAEVRAGAICGALVSTAVYDELQRLVIDPIHYKEAALNAHAAFRRDFTLERMEESFFEFLGRTRESLANASRKPISFDIPSEMASPPLPPKRFSDLIKMTRSIGSTLHRRIKSIHSA